METKRLPNPQDEVRFLASLLHAPERVRSLKTEESCEGAANPLLGAYPSGNGNAL